MLYLRYEKYVFSMKIPFSKHKSCMFYLQNPWNQSYEIRLETFHFKIGIGKDKKKSSLKYIASLLFNPYGDFMLNSFPNYHIIYREKLHLWQMYFNFPLYCCMFFIQLSWWNEKCFHACFDLGVFLDSSYWWDHRSIIWRNRLIAKLKDGFCQGRADHLSKNPTLMILQGSRSSHLDTRVVEIV